MPVEPPVISVIMPVYNRAATVRRAIDSVLGQDFADFELIVVDDASSDGSAEAVAAVADPRVKLVRLAANGGSNAARNRGIAAARAPLIAFLDSDDSYLPHKLGTVVRLFAERPEIDVLLDSFTKLYPPGHPREKADRRNPVIDANAEFVAALFGRRLWKATSAITLRKDAAVRAGLFDETLKRRQDLDFLIRVSRVARCASIDQVLWVKTWTAGAISDNPASFMSATLELARRYPEYLANPRYRTGLARDVTRHLGLLLVAGKFGRFARDGRVLMRAFGPRRVAGLIGEGSGELVRRGNRRRRRART